MAVAAAALRGVDMASHCSRPLHPGTLADFDMIFAMEATQSRWLKRRYPQYSGKVYLLPLFDPLVQEHGKRRGAFYKIEDPFGKPFVAYSECFERIERCLAAAARTMG
jgi:protein-tyrosine-phosphatase